MEFSSQLISYKEIREGYKPKRDDCKLFAYLTDTRKKALFANPNLQDDSACMLNLEFVDGVVAGRTMSYDTKMKIGDSIVKASSGSALDVAECYRHLGVGATLMMNVVALDYDYLVFAGISDQALPLYKKLRYHILEYPRLMLLKNSRPILYSKGMKGVVLDVVSFILNLPIRLFSSIVMLRSRRVSKHYQIVEEKVVPQWVNDIIKDDKSKYMEVHDQSWLQWNLDYNFNGLEKDTQHFFSVYKNDRPLGFFMTKERYKEKAGSLKSVLVGSIVEWGAFDEDVLSEFTLCKMALSKFSSDIHIIEMASSNKKTISSMKKLGFVQYGFAHIVFKDKTKKHKDAADINNWRIRYGYSDVIMT